MKNAISDGGADLGVGPGGLALAETCGEKSTHRAIHPQSLPQTVLRRYGPIDSHLTLMSGAKVIGLDVIRHVETLRKRTNTGKRCDQRS